ncbi:MAG: molybdopterin-dependent oxidoreductase [Tenuifilaceae bacterium]|nr:molybdopterin-dependent oxidoreductase [Tenuifilaceae bacterium]
MTIFSKVKGNTGTNRGYSSDVQLPGMLHCKALRSPYSRADILSIDTTSAEAMPGVHLVMSINNYPKLFFNQLVFIGQEIALVIAETEEIAKKATRLIKVEYDVLPFAVEPIEAMKPDAPVTVPVHPFPFLEKPTDNPNVTTYSYAGWYSEPNEKGICTKRTVPYDYHGFGDIEQGEEEAEVIVESEGFSYGLQHASIMETGGCVADAKDDVVDLYTHGYWPYVTRYLVASKVGIPISKLNVINYNNGGDFGSHVDGGQEPSNVGPSYNVTMVIASLALQRPVRYFYTPDEEMMYRWGRGGCGSRDRYGFKKDGTLVFMDQDFYRNYCTGDAFIGINFSKFNGCSSGLKLYAHNCKHQKLTGYHVYTNGPGHTGWQGFGCPEAHFPVNVTMDMAAEKLGIDPVEFQKINHPRAGDHWYDDCYGWTQGVGHWMAPTGMDKALNIGAEQIGWSSWQHPSEKTGRIRHGIGVALAMQNTGGEDLYSSAIVSLTADGSAILYANNKDAGQGAWTREKAITAEVLGIEFEKVQVGAGETKHLIRCGWQLCSSGTLTQGKATYDACMQAKEKLFDLAAPKLGVNPEDLDTKDGVIFVKSDESKKMTWGQLIMSLGPRSQDWDIVGYARHQVGPGPTPQDKNVNFISLDVDTETGQISNIKCSMNICIGKAIFPRAVEGIGLGVHHALDAMVGGCAIFDPTTGKLLNDTWVDYTVASIGDSEVYPNCIEYEGDPTHPYGASGCGQATQDAVAGAFSNALYNAIGVRMKEVPFTPDKILKALGKI